MYTSLFKYFHDIFEWSYEEMPTIYPQIVEHKNRTYKNAKHFRQKMRPMNPRKVATIKIEVEKLLKASFIYPIPRTEWVSILVLIDK
jgi:uncharacterized protein Yka (UPF0111/DUF47 family)